MSRNVLARAALTSIAVVLVAFPAAIVLGGYIPDLPPTAFLGAYLTTDLPAIVVWTLAALALVVVALRLGGGRFTKLLADVIVVVLAGALVAGGTLWTLAASNDAPYAPELRLFPGSGHRSADERVVFATVDGVDLHAELWRPFRVPEAGPAEPGPALVYVHGGAFIGGGLGDQPWLFQSVTEAGFIVIDVEYRLAPPPRWHDAPADVLCALGWVAEHADELRIDPTRVVLAGDSAGGSLALVAGYAAGTDAIEPSCAFAAAPLVPTGILAIEPAADLRGIWEDSTIADGSARFPEAYIGGSPFELPERYDAASPFDLIRVGIPRTLIVAAANDHLVRLRRVQSIADALELAQAHVRLIVIPFADHGFSGNPAGAGAQLLSSLVPRFMRNPPAVIGR